MSSCGGTNNKIDTRQSNRRKETGFNSRVIRYHRNGTQEVAKAGSLLFLDKAIIHFEELTGQRNLSFGGPISEQSKQSLVWNSK